MRHRDGTEKKDGERMTCRLHQFRSKSIDESIYHVANDIAFVSCTYTSTISMVVLKKSQKNASTERVTCYKTHVANSDDLLRLALLRSKISIIMTGDVGCSTRKIRLAKFSIILINVSTKHQNITSYHHANAYNQSNIPQTFFLSYHF